MPLPDVEYGAAYAAGPHRFLCGDLESGDWLKCLALASDPIGMVYSDPPWSAGNCRYWRTHAGKDRGRMDWPDFARRWCEAVAACRAAVVYVEQSLRWWESFAREAEKACLPPLSGKWTVYYGAPVTTGDRIVCCRRPNLLLRFARSSWTGNPEGLHGEEMTRHVFTHEPVVRAGGGIVADPCVGKGMTCRMAHRFGMRCIGLELNPSRLAVTLGWLAKQGMASERIAAS